ncbi:hypothetical protein BJ165DRAFT_416485 [Panaeolus papilionaceus]|nr:hypothetical protein BJ165DRAFT_416485 [Panaeolus papilionaceus]
MDKWYVPHSRSFELPAFVTACALVTVRTAIRFITITGEINVFRFYITYASSSLHLRRTTLPLPASHYQQSRKPRESDFGTHQPTSQSLSLLSRPESPSLRAVSPVLEPYPESVGLLGCSFHELKRPLVGSHRRFLALRSALYPPFIQLSLYLSSPSSPVRPSSHWIPATVAS